MTDFEKAVEFLSSMGIDYLVEERHGQGNESSLMVITLPQIGSKHIQKWFFFDQIGGKTADQNKTPGQFYTTDYGEYLEPYWPPDEE